VKLFIIILWASAHEPVCVSDIYWDLVNTNMFGERNKSELKLELLSLD